MHFKEIEVSGFKSFPDRTQIRLEQGVTAIVGPNGCGKSNVLDALRWVLGEQNPRELRGQHMMDVIFNGSENRPPMGMAEVSATFDNSDLRLPVDFTEVQITRRLYRSGESEYFINRAPCRLRDIHELFMDTGIGTSAYSLIGQGKIGLVLSSKPEDRRFLFEEAAGIIKYKARKRVAMRKLESADHNLVRLNDIVQEVHRQMRALKRQVNAALRYRELKQELCELELRAIWLKYARLKEQIRSLGEQLTGAKDRYTHAMAEMAAMEARNEELALKRIEVERDLMSRREAVQQVDVDMEQAERQIALLRQQIEFLGEQQRQALTERDAFLARAAALEQDIGQTVHALGELEAAAARSEREIDACQARHEAAAERLREAEQRTETLQHEAVDSLNSRAKAETELETLAVSIQNLESFLSELAERRRQFEARRAELEQKSEGLRETESNLRRELEQTTAEIARMASEIGEKRTRLKSKLDEWQALREKKSSVQARLHSLCELRDSYEGYATGVRAVMMARQRQPEFSRVIGPVGDLVTPPKVYERAIEAALGGSINNVVVEDGASAKAAVDFLKVHQAGRVTFLPLDMIRPGQHDDTDAVLGRPGVIGPAINHVKFDPHIRKAVEYLLYNVVIVETLDVAISIARSGGRYPRMVTVDGEYVSPSGAITGGNWQTETRGLLGRGAEIAELEQEVQRIQDAAAETASLADALTREIQAVTQQSETMEANAKTVRERLNELGVDLARVHMELQTLDVSVRQSLAETDARTTQRDELEARRQQALLIATNMQEDNETLQQALEKQRATTGTARDELERISNELADLRVKQAALTQRIEECRRNLARQQAERDEAREHAAQRLTQSTGFKENQESLSREIERHIERTRELAAKKESAHAKVIEVQTLQHALLDETDALAKTLREVNEQARTVQAEVHRLEMDLRHDEDQVGFLEERALAEYHVGLASVMADSVGSDELDDEAREARVAEIREKLDRLGEVNVMAIEEYEQLEKRYEFLVTQERDLSKARETLLGIVAKIDSIIRNRFMETFERVSENFRVFFRRLFNGGQARIYLMDESDPLECGIEIEARPPGKKPQGISLLSGGEQAMTAIALLFSIFKAKPSPFCVLDEVDAPLDDANIGRFLDMVQEFTNESQFIIITHSKQTMARANVLYGITMQERGVSQLVSVKFDEPVRPKADLAAALEESEGASEAEPAA